MKIRPLHSAAAGGKADLVALLLGRGADVDAQQEGGWTALHGEKTDPKIVRLLRR